ncbi:MAG: hypothetical protein IKU65_00935 [Oscillospiraceae bacterium]|nr:hypothetical protein [Oscillospiraceae bacterium]
MKSRKITIRILIIVVFFSLLVLCLAAFLGRNAAKNFSVRGVDVSAYQGVIDWQVLSQNDIDFAFIKATEGSTFKDRLYADNVKGAKETALAVGAYHFMSFESEGESQAQNFIETVDRADISLPPVIDLELYGQYNHNPPDFGKVQKILDGLIAALSEEYGTKPIIYTNRRAYSLYISGRYRDCDIWICDILKRPTLPDGREWTFWQYSHTERLPGYSGEEKHIDMNVFAGNRQDFREYTESLVY